MRFSRTELGGRAWLLGWKAPLRKGPRARGDSMSTQVAFSEQLPPNSDGTTGSPGEPGQF